MHPQNVKETRFWAKCKSAQSLQFEFRTTHHDKREDKMFSSLRVPNHNFVMTSYTQSANPTYKNSPPLLGVQPPKKWQKSKRSPDLPFSKCSVETMVIVQTNRHKVSRRWMLHRWDFPLQFLIGQLLFPKFHQQFCKTINQILFGKIFTYFVNNLNWTDSKNTATAALIEQTPWISQLFLFFYLRGLSLYNI